MLSVRNTKVYDLKESIIACRNAMRTELPEYTEEEFEKSLERAIKLANSPAGSGHQTFLSGIRVSFDLIYPNYISPELQRYHWVDIVTSSSKMHRLVKMDLDVACTKYVTNGSIYELKHHINNYNSIKNDEDFKIADFTLRDGKHLITTDKSEALYWAFMFCINNCPMGLELFMRVSTNYQQLRTIYNQRKSHKLKEDWGAFCGWIETLPYAKELIIGERK